MDKAERALTWQIGLISASAALVGALIGGMSSVYVSNEQAKTQLQVSSRQERLTVYEAWLNDADGFNRAIVSLEGADAAGFRAKWESLGSAKELLRQETNTASLVGSSKVRADALRVDNSASDYYSAISKAWYGYFQSKRGDAKNFQAQINKEISQAVTDMSKDLTGF